MMGRSLSNVRRGRESLFVGLAVVRLSLSLSLKNGSSVVSSRLRPREVVVDAASSAIEVSCARSLNPGCWKTGDVVDFLLSRLKEDFRGFFMTFPRMWDGSSSTREVRVH